MMPSFSYLGSVLLDFSTKWVSWFDPRDYWHDLYNHTYCIFIGRKRVEILLLESFPDLWVKIWSLLWSNWEWDFDVHVVVANNTEDETKFLAH